jgi:hypothetical protein
MQALRNRKAGRECMGKQDPTNGIPEQCVVLCCGG